jgi:hypothetical protein
MDVHRAVREAQEFLTNLINSENINGVYQEPQGHYYATHQPSQPDGNGYRDDDGDSVGSNGYRFVVVLLNGNSNNVKQSG